MTKHINTREAHRKLARLRSPTGADLFRQLYCLYFGMVLSRGKGERERREEKSEDETADDDNTAGERTIRA